MRLRYLFFLLTALGLLASGAVAEARSQAVIRNIYIGPELVDCPPGGTGPATEPQRCYEFREEPEESWRPLIADLEGLEEWEEGFIYHLRVEVTEVSDPAGGAPRTHYKVLNLLSKLPENPQPLVPRPLPASIVGKTWSLVALPGDDGEVEDTAESGISVMFDDAGGVTGSGGCNSYSAFYETGLNNEIEVEGVVSTKKACDGDIMAREVRYFEALEKAGSWAQDDPDRLQLKISSGQALEYVVGSGVTPGMPTTGAVDTHQGVATGLTVLAALAVLSISLGLLLVRGARERM